MPMKLRDLCRSFPKISRPQSPLDNIASWIFYTGHDGAYIQSTSPPEDRYGVKVDTQMQYDHNALVSDFSTFGPNERYLINKILYSPSSLLYVVSGVGTGKTRFFKFFQDHVLPTLRDQADTSPRTTCLHYDFLDDAHRYSPSEAAGVVRTQFLRSFCSRAEGVIADLDLFGVEHEVVAVWQSLVSAESRYKQTPALSFIIRELREQDAGGQQLEVDYRETLRRRKKIRNQLLRDDERRFSYLTILLRYINQTYFGGGYGRFVVVIDNVDREPAIVQQEVKQIMKPFARISGVRTIITARQSTFYQQYDDGVSEPIDVLPYCGPTPTEITSARLKTFQRDHSDFARFYSPEALPDLVRGVETLWEHYFSHELCRNLFTSLCGRSVRKTLILAQRLIHNSVYDPVDVGTKGLKQAGVTIGDVLRALLVGAEETYTWRPDNIIENLFQVQTHPGSSYLIKVRILRALAYSDHGLRLSTLYSALRGFGYSPGLICDALNEMKETPRRLLWSNAVQRSFEGDGDLVRLGPTRLELSSVGIGYHDYLFHNLDYVQEVMLDTVVPPSFGYGWEYAKLEQRFDLVFKFLSLIYESDCREVRNTLTNSSVEEYRNVFGAGTLLSLEILRGVHTSVQRILDSIHSSRAFKDDSRRQLEEFKVEHLADYAAKLVEAENMQVRLFND